jgi:hypothetical protein
MVGRGILMAGSTTVPSPRLCIAGILFGITTMGPGLAYGLGSLMLRLYVDIDRMPEGEPVPCSSSSGMHTNTLCI